MTHMISVQRRSLTTTTTTTTTTHSLRAGCNLINRRTSTSTASDVVSRFVPIFHRADKNLRRHPDTHNLQDDVVFKMNVTVGDSHKFSPANGSSKS